MPEKVVFSGDNLLICDSKNLQISTCSKGVRPIRNKGKRIMYLRTLGCVLTSDFKAVACTNQIFQAFFVAPNLFVFEIQYVDKFLYSILWVPFGV